MRRASLQLVPRQPFVLREQTAQQTRPRGFCTYMESFLRDLLRPPRRSLRPVRISPPARAAAPRFPAPPRFPVHLTALELRTETADGTLWQTEQRPPRRSLLRPVRIRPPARAAAAAAASTSRCPKSGSGAQCVRPLLSWKPRACLDIRRALRPHWSTWSAVGKPSPLPCPDTQLCHAPQSPRI